jgi:hypothetical protein
MCVTCVPTIPISGEVSMDSLEDCRERGETLERRICMVEQRLRWWRSLTGGGSC